MNEHLNLNQQNGLRLLGKKVDWVNNKRFIACLPEDEQEIEHELLCATKALAVESDGSLLLQLTDIEIVIKFPKDTGEQTIKIKASIEASIPSDEWEFDEEQFEKSPLNKMES